MSDKSYILAIDQGTSSTKTLIFDKTGQAIAKWSEALHTNYLDNGFVEQDPEGIYNNVLASVKNCLQEFSDKGFSKKNIAAIGVSNQRETFVVWEKGGKPLHAAIVWQCKRSVKICEQLKQKGLTTAVQQKTGLIVDPYFSATKLIWLFENNRSVNEAIKSGNAFFGTIDTWLLYRFTKGKEYATDHTNASRTLLFNIHSLQWDEELIKEFGLSGIQLPRVNASSSLFGATTLDGLFENPLPITALVGDSQAAAFGENCVEAGTAKATLGTGCSILMNTGSRPVQSTNGIVTTICWSAGHRVDYALEGVIVSCGASIEWLKNEMNLLNDSKESELMANAVNDNGGVYLVPAFSGLGSPYWQMDRRASLSGMSFSTTKNHIVRAALESISYQIKDVITVMEKEADLSLSELMANGGMATNRFVMELTADLLEKKVSVTAMPDISALGAAYLAGLQAKFYDSIESLKKLNPHRKYFLPGKSNVAKQNYRNWLRYVNTDI